MAVHMKVIQFPLDVNYVNTFLAIDEDTRQAFLVDCGKWDSAVQSYLQEIQLNLVFLLVTHSHSDHVGGVENFQKDYQIPIYSNTDKWEQQVRAGDQIPFANQQISVLQTPGHTQDGVSYFVANSVFVGDAIFAGAVGGTTTRENFWQQNNAVWTNILSLPDETVIYPGHGAPSTVGIEKRFNPFFTQQS